jgi:hypothetical protein
MMGDFRNRILGFNQDPACVTQPDFRQAVNKSIACPLAAKPDLTREKSVKQSLYVSGVISRSKFFFMV